LLRSGSKLKRGVIEGTGGCYLFSVFVEEENFMTTNKKSTVISIGDHIYPLDKTLSVPN
jgi:hypothetical protein